MKKACYSPSLMKDSSTLKRSEHQTTTVRRLFLASWSALLFGMFNFANPGGYPGASAAKLRSEYESAQISFEDAERKLRDTQEAYEKLKVARGCNEIQDEASPYRKLFDATKLRS